MSGDINIDVGSAIPYAIDRVLSLFGKDTLSVLAKEKLQKRLKVAVEESSRVQCIGMAKPIPIEQIYQKTRVRTHQYTSSDIDGSYEFMEIYNRGENAVFWGGPGAGKTMLMRWVFLKLLKDKECIPLLFTLRYNDAVEDLSALIKDLSSKTVKVKGNKIILLIDGYDEIDVKNRKEVSQKLNEFASLSCGNFFLTCRLHYDVVNLVAPFYYIEPFLQSDAKNYATAFFDAYGFKYDVDVLLNELSEKGFADFLTSPLMLALVCILKTGPLPHLPKNTLGLIRRALDTLTFRWDESRGLARPGEIPLDGEERIRCLMRIAFHFDKPLGNEATALQHASKHLHYLQRTDIPPAKLLQEIAQWYGIFVPVSNAYWSFTHKTIHDYLAARFWVESGSFHITSSATAPVIRWDARTAYAACLIPDATNVIMRSIEKSDSLYVLTECLANNAPFITTQVSRSIIRYFERHLDKEIHYSKNNKQMIVSVEQDFLRLASNEFLQDLANEGLRDVDDSHVAIFCLALSEMKVRNSLFKPSTTTSFKESKILGLSVNVKRGGVEIPIFTVKEMCFGLK